MEKLLIEITTQIFIAQQGQRPITDLQAVERAAEIARHIFKVQYEDSLRAQLHNLKQDYDSLHEKWKDLVFEAHKVQEEMRDK